MRRLFYQPLLCKVALSKAITACEPLANCFFKFPRSLCDFGFDDNSHKIAMIFIPSVGIGANLWIIKTLCKNTQAFDLAFVSFECCLRFVFQTSDAGA